VMGLVTCGLVTARGPTSSNSTNVIGVSDQVKSSTNWRMKMSDKFPSKEALMRELQHHLSYMKSLYEKDQQVQSLSDVAFTFLIKDMERIIHAVEHNLELDDRVPSIAKKEDEPAILDMFPFVDEFGK